MKTRRILALATREGDQQVLSLTSPSPADRYHFHETPTRAECGGCSVPDSNDICWLSLSRLSLCRPERVLHQPYIECTSTLIKAPCNAIAVILHKRFSGILGDRAERRHGCCEYRRLLENCAN